MLRVLSLCLALLTFSGEASALTVQWDCNPEADVKEYRVEYSKDAGASWGIEATVPHPKPCTSPVQLGITRYLAPGEKLFRLFAIDLAGNVSTVPSQSASYTVKPPLIGSTGGQVEEAIPPSPYKPAPVVPPTPPAPVPTPPPPVVVPPPPAPAPVVKPGPLTGLQVVDMAQTSGMLQFDPIEGAGADIRVSLAPISWGTATSVTCSIDGDCPLQNLLPGKTYEAMGVRYFGKMNQGAAYGDLSGVYRFTTLPIPVTPPPPVPPSPPSITLKDALQSGLDTCLTKKLAHTACMKALSDAIGKVNP